jgi:hypothetical protein
LALDLHRGSILRSATIFFSCADTKLWRACGEGARSLAKISEFVLHGEYSGGRSNRSSWPWDFDAGQRAGVGQKRTIEPNDFAILTRAYGSTFARLVRATGDDRAHGGMVALR